MVQITKGIKRCLSKSPYQLHWFQWEVLCSHTRFQQPKQITRSLKHSQQVPYSIRLCHTNLSFFAMEVYSCQRNLFLVCVDLYPRVGISPKIAAFCGPLASTSNHLQHPWYVLSLQLWIRSPSFRWHPKYNGVISHELHPNPIFYRAPGPCHLPYMNTRPAQHLRTRGFLEWSNLSTFWPLGPFNFLTFGEIPASRPAYRIPSTTIPE